MGGEESKQLNEINNNKIIQSINDLYKKEDKNKIKTKIINEKNQNSYEIKNSNLNNNLNNENIIHLFQNILPDLCSNVFNKFNNNAIYYNLICNNLFHLENLSQQKKNDFLFYSQKEFNNYTNELLSIEEKNKNLGNKIINKSFSKLNMNIQETINSNDNKIKKEIIYFPKENIDEIISNSSSKKKEYTNNMSIHGTISKIYKLNYEDEKLYNEIINYNNGLEIGINNEENDLSINETSKITFREESFYSKDESIHQDIDKILSSRKPKINTRIIYEKKKIKNNKIDDNKIKRIKSNKDESSIEKERINNNDIISKINKSNECDSKKCKNLFENNHLINEKKNIEIIEKINPKNVKINENFFNKENMNNSIEQYKIISQKMESLINNRNEEEKNEEIKIKSNLRFNSNNNKNNTNSQNKKYKKKDIIVEKGNKYFINKDSLNETDKNTKKQNIIIEKNKNNNNIIIEKEKNKNNNNIIIEKEKKKNNNNIIIEKEKNKKNHNILIEKEKNKNNKNIIIENEKKKYINKEHNKNNSNFIIENKKRRKKNKEIITVEQNCRNDKNKEFKIDNINGIHNFNFEKKNKNDIQINYNSIPNKRLLLKEKEENEKRKNNHDLIHQMGNRFLNIKLSSYKYPKIEKEYNIDLSKYNNKIDFLKDNQNILKKEKEIINPFKKNNINNNDLIKYKMNNIVENKYNDIINENENLEELFNSDYTKNLIHSNSNPNYNTRNKNDKNSFKIDLEEIIKDVENDSSKKKYKKENKNKNNLNSINGNNNYLYEGLSFIDAIDKFLELDKRYLQKNQINKKKGSIDKKNPKSIIKPHNSEKIDYSNLNNLKTISKLNQSKRYTNKESSISNTINYGNPNYSLTISKEDENIITQKNSINSFNINNNKINHNMNQGTTNRNNLLSKKNISTYNLLSKSQNLTTNYNLLNQQIIEKNFKNNSLIDSQINISQNLLNNK